MRNCSSLLRVFESMATGLVEAAVVWLSFSLLVLVFVPPLLTVPMLPPVAPDVPLVPA